jgi:hypothetical protein
MRYIKLISYLFILSVAFLFAHSASALTITPVRLEISGDPGQMIVKPVTLINEQKTEATFYSSFANFEAQGETGNPSFVDPKEDLGTWIRTNESITLAPGESKDVNLIIDIPKNAYAGGHFAVVFFGTMPNSGGENNGVGIGAKTGILILLSVNGDVLEKGGLSSFNLLDNKVFYNSLPVNFIYRFKNDGNDRVKPEGKINIHNIFYYPSARLNANPVSGNILPHSTRRFEVEWIKEKADPNNNPSSFILSSFFDRASFQWKNFAVGPYWATLDLVYGSQKTHVSKTVFLFVFPWQLLICIAIIFVIILFIGKKLLKRYNKYVIKQARLSMNIKDDAKNDK